MILIGANPLISFAPEEYWLTGQLSYTDAFGFVFYTFRTVAFDANLFPKGQITLLGLLAIPYLFTRYLITLIFWSILIFYIRKEFMIKNIDINEKTIQRILFTTIDYFISYREYIEEGSKYLITKSDKSSQLNVGIENQNILNLMNLLEQDRFLSDIIPKEEDQKHQLYKDLRQLFFKKSIRLWRPEFSYLFEKVEKQGLYIIYNDGRDVFNYTFIKEHLQDPGLISGMFSAISSFIKETTKSTQLLKTIDHGDITILIEYGSYVFGALFIKGNQTTEIRDQLKEFISIFERNHKEILPDWSGILTPFKQDNLLVSEIFIEE
jgi:hypothetical protein